MTAGTNANTLKAIEAGWVATGYPGPAFPPVTSPADPNDQIAIIDGNSSGIIVDEIDARYNPGDEILAAVYSGTVMTIPDFTYTVASTVTIGTTQNRNNAITMSVTKNTAFTGVVDLVGVRQLGQPGRPVRDEPVAADLQPVARHAEHHDHVDDVQHDGGPGRHQHDLGPGPLVEPVPDRSLLPGRREHRRRRPRLHAVPGPGSSSPSRTPARPGPARCSFSTPNNNSTYFGGTVNLTVEGGPQANGVLPSGIGAVSVSPSSFVLNKNGRQDVTISVNGGTLGPGEYPLTIRATGTNSAGQVVTRMIPFTFDVATAGTSSNYVDILGFAVFRITSANSNSIDGYAISGVYADMNDPALRRGQVARLAPWN